LTGLRIWAKAFLVLPWADDNNEVKMNRVLLFCLLLATAAPSSQADDTWHNIYHSLKRFFTGEDKHSSSSKRKHSPSRNSHTRSGSEESPSRSAEPRIVVLPESTPSVSNPVAKSAEGRPADANPASAAPAVVKSPEVAAPTPKLPEPVETGTTKKGAINTKAAEPTPTVDSSPVLRSVPGPQ